MVIFTIKEMNCVVVDVFHDSVRPVSYLYLKSLAALFVFVPT